MDMAAYHRAIFSISNASDFRACCLWAFRYQYRNVPVYQSFVNALGIDPDLVNAVHKIPFLPVECFREHRVCDAGELPSLWFESSGTTGQIPSRHYLRAPQLYDTSLMKGFKSFVGDPRNMAILALLPGYLDRPHASLVYMASELIRESQHPASGFYTHADATFVHWVHQLNKQKEPNVVLGVSFALLDWAEQHPMPLPELRIMETGGMKGRRKEIIREALHNTLRQAFHVPQVWSEYGMTEMLSQAYARKDGLFESPPWLRWVLRDPGDPFALGVSSGGINAIDLANIHSCCFLASQDLGRLHAFGKLEVLGRFDAAETRGCNLMVP